MLNGSDAVKEETRKVVLDAMEKLSYNTNLLARNLRLQKTHMILVIISTIEGKFFGKVVDGITKYCNENKYQIMVAPNNDNIDSEKAYVDLLKNKIVDGIIFLNSCMDRKEIEELNKNYPIMLCSEYFENSEVPFVSIDNFQGGYDMTAHLIKNGSNRIAHINTDNGGVSANLRLKGYKKALKDNDITIDYNLIVNGNYGFWSGYKCAKKLIEDYKVDGIFAINDLMAAGSIKAALEYDLVVGKDILIGGFDNTKLTKIYNPDISTVSQSRFLMGVKSAEMLLKKIHGEDDIKNIFLDHEVIVRTSSRGIIK